MAEIKDLLLNFKNIIHKGDAEKEVIVRIFKKVIGREIIKEDISFKRDTLCIRSDAYLKAEIKLHKNILLREIKKQAIEKVITEIK